MDLTCPRTAPRVARMGLPPETSPAEWDARGARLISLELSIYPEASTDIWTGLFERLKLKPAEPGGQKFHSFVALPAKPQDHVLSGVVHLMSDNPSSAHWSLHFLPFPSDPPPDDVKAMSDAVGGVEGFLRSIAGGWPTPGRSTVDVPSAGYALDPARWVGVRRFAEWVTQEAPPLRLDMVGWQVSPPSGPIERISQVRTEANPRAVVLLVSGSASLLVGPNLLREADEVLWQGLHPLLAQVAG